MNISSLQYTLVKNQKFSKLESIIHRWRQGAHLKTNENEKSDKMIGMYALGQNAFY